MNMRFVLEKLNVGSPDADTISRQTGDLFSEAQWKALMCILVVI